MRNPIIRLYNAGRALWQRYRMPLRLELSLTDHCNLNCKGCTHYCPIAPEHYMSVESIKHALNHLAGIDNTMFKHIYLLGGEPLLHPHISRVCQLVRDSFPLAEIKILTNGLRIPLMDEDFWTTCHNTGAIISATIYPIKLDYDKVKQLCEIHNVKYEIFHQPEGDKFFSKHTIDECNPGNRHVNFIKCYEVGCLTLRDSRIFPCATSAYADLINNRFGRNFEHQKPSQDGRCGDYIEVNQVTSSRDLKRLKNRPTPFCRYCTKLQPTAWALSKKEASEWLP